MRKTFLFSFLLLMAINLYGQSKNYLDQPYLETNASADTLVVPDRIYLGITIRESDTKDRSSVEELENKMVAALKAIGINTDDQLMLSNLDSNFKNYFLKKTDVLKSKSFTLLVYDGLTAGKAIQSLENNNIANVNFQKAEVSNIEELQLALRKKAVENAVTQAKSMLEPLGQSLGKALYISDLNTGIVYGWQNRMASMEVAMARSDQYEPVNVDFEKVKISSNVNVKFAIE